jgi:hypothetical protein
LPEETELLEEVATAVGHTSVAELDERFARTTADIRDIFLRTFD